MKKTLITLSFLLIGLIGMAQTKDSVKVQPKVELAQPVFKQNQGVIFNLEQSKTIIQILETSKQTILKSSNGNTTEQNLQLLQNLTLIIEEFNRQLPKKEGK